jgi:leucyl aminopeptidase
MGTVAILDSLTSETGDARPVHVVVAEGFEGWRDAQPERWRNWLAGSGFEAKAGRVIFLPGADGGLEAALLIASAPASPWDFASLRRHLPEGAWRLEATAGLDLGIAALGFALGGYRFDRYLTKPESKSVRLALEEGPAVRRAKVLAEAVALARDLINTPASDMGPAELEEAARAVAEAADADIRTITGDDLLAQNYPTIHTVGAASVRAPRVIDLRWGDPGAPKLTLVGKGVCFDTGGLDIKPSQGMLNMKKDMGGAAVTLALAQAVMTLGLPLRLRLLIGAVENSISGASFRPGDIIRTRNGTTVEIGNTDAEGRLVLCDLLPEADGEAPHLLLDCATLTGAARVALGPDLPALFTPDDGLADLMLKAGQDAFDPLWRLPLHAPYREMLDSGVADINNTGAGGFAGSITAALFLQRFVEQTSAWAHLDIFCWSPKERPGRPKGGEASALRALLATIERRFGG